MTQRDVWGLRLVLLLLFLYFGLFLYTWEIGRFLHPV